MSIAKHIAHPKLAFPLVFLACFAALMTFYYALPSNFTELVFVRIFAVLPGGFILDWLTPHHTVTTDQTRIVSSLARLNVLKGCEGTEALLILYAAIIAALRPKAKTFAGLLWGTLLIFLLNQARIVSLFFIAAYERNLFEPVHGFIAPIFILVITGAYFLWWLQWSAPTAHH